MLSISMNKQVKELDRKLFDYDTWLTTPTEPWYVEEPKIEDEDGAYDEFREN